MNSNESKKCFTVWENCLCITLGQSVKLYYERKRKLATRTLWTSKALLGVLEICEGFFILREQRLNYSLPLGIMHLSSNRAAAC